MCLHVNERQFYIFGDAAYMLRPWIQVAFPSVGASEAHALYNTLMSAVHVSVDWTYKDLKQLWLFADFTRALKVRQAPIALIYKAAALLQNFMACMEGRGQVNEYFDFPRPTFLNI